MTSPGAPQRRGVKGLGGPKGGCVAHPLAAQAQRDVPHAAERILGALVVVVQRQAGDPRGAGEAHPQSVVAPAASDAPARAAVKGISHMCVSSVVTLTPSTSLSSVRRSPECPSTLMSWGAALRQERVSATSSDAAEAARDPWSRLRSPQAQAGQAGVVWIAVRRQGCRW